MIERKRLIELLEKVAIEKDCPQMDVVADYLLANGVIVPPAPIGTKYYRVVEKQGKYKGVFYYIREAKLDYYNVGKALKDFGKTVFLSREEAEKALEEREGK
ncbi:MAG: hypothetical protein IKB02_09835 [Clostridia bacterium]|nr:hypothetical protein [Clostridia bacterium]MBR2389033.1 hypothetical protein [Clostridia bacterium]